MIMQYKVVFRGSIRTRIATRNILWMCLHGTTHAPKETSTCGRQFYRKNYSLNKQTWDLYLAMPTTPLHLSFTLNNSRAKQSRMHLCNTFCAANLTITGTGILLLHRGFLFLSFPTDKKHGVQS